MDKTLYALTLSFVLASVAGCGGGELLCQSDGDCKKSGTPGKCIENNCAYTDSECLRWDDSASALHKGMCVPQQHDLSVVTIDMSQPPGPDLTIVDSKVADASGDMSTADGHGPDLATALDDMSTPPPDLRTIDMATVEISVPDIAMDLSIGPVACVFDRNKFDDGCHFGP